MAKKKAKQVKAKVRPAVQTATKGRKNKAAYILSLIAVFILLLNALLVFFMKNTLSDILVDIGMEVDSSTLLTYGVIWLVLSFLVWLTTYEIEKKNESSQKWFLLVLSILIVIAGRLESGVLTFIASILYLKAK